MRHDYVARARALVGCAFRPQGRDPAVGLDCVGLTLRVYRLKGEFRRNYNLRGNHRRELETELHPFFRAVRKSEIRDGDLCLWSVASEQLHLGVSAGQSFVHADASLRRVVETPGAPPWRLLRVYRPRLRITSGG